MATASSPSPSIASLVAELAAERAARAAVEAENVRLQHQVTHLTEFRARAYNLTNLLPLAVLVIDAAGLILLLNQGYAELFDVPASEWLGRSVVDLLAQNAGRFRDSDDYLTSTYAIAESGQSSRSELLLLTDGRTVERDTVALPEGGWLIGYREVTERDRARQARHRAEARLAQVLREVRVGTLLLDPEQCVVMVNQFLLDLFSLPDAPGAIVGMTGEELRERLLPAFANPAAVRELSTRDRSTMPRGASGAPLPLLLADGRAVELTTQPLTEAAGGGWLITYRDVTEREQARREQHRSEVRASLLVRELPLGLLLTDPAGRVLLANAELGRLLDLPATPANLVGQPLKRVIRRALAAFARPAEVRAWSRVIPRGRMPVRNLQLGLTDGRVIEVDAQPLAEAEGGGWLISARDVTARETARREVAEQRAFYETVLNHLPSDVAVLDAEHRYQFVNPVAVSDPAIRRWIIGRTDAEYVRRRQRPAAVAERRFALFAEAIRERRVVTWEEDMPAPDGTLRTLRRHLQPVFDSTTGALRMMIGYGFDLTALRAAQRAVDEQRTFYETVLDNLPADVAVFDADLRYRYLNPQAQPNDELRHWVVGRTWEEYVERVQVPPERAAQRRQVVASVLETGGVVAWDEHIIDPVSGASRILWRHLRPLFHADGSPFLLIGYGIDITDVREAQRVAEAAARARENFLANMSHEIRTPLNGVLGMVALLGKTPLSATQREFLEIVGASGRHLLALLNDVLDMAKINSGHLELESAPFNVLDALRTAAQNVAFRVTEQGVTLLIETAGAVALGSVMGDAYRLQQVLLNLLTNAVKFTPGGEVRLAARVLDSTTDGVRIRFSVVDTGLGIPLDRQEAVFEEFTQAYTDTTRRFGGTGLGLAISQQLVSRMGGHLVLTSEPGLGTTFAFTVRLERAATAVPEQRNAPSASSLSTAALPSLHGRRILLVEDQEVNRLLARLLLEANGATVAEAPGGPQALAWMAAHPAPDVVLMDIQMPGMSGLDVTRRIRRLGDPARAAVPIVALTANAFKADVERYLAAGMNACLTKPFEEAELVRLIDSLVGPLPPKRVEPADSTPDGTQAATPLLQPAAEPGQPADPTDSAAMPAYPAPLFRLARGNEAFARRIVASFCANAPTDLAALRTAADTDDPETAAAIAHRLIPSARLFEVPELVDTLVELELAPVISPTWREGLAFAVQELDALLARLGELLKTA